MALLSVFLGDSGIRGSLRRPVWHPLGLQGSLLSELIFILCMCFHVVIEHLNMFVDNIPTWYKFQKIEWKESHCTGTATKVAGFWAVDGNDSSVLISWFHLCLTVYIVENVLICTKYTVKYLEVKRQYTGNLFIHKSLRKKPEVYIVFKTFLSCQEIHIYIWIISYIYDMILYVGVPKIFPVRVC